MGEHRRKDNARLRDDDAKAPNATACARSSKHCAVRVGRPLQLMPSRNLTLPYFRKFCCKIAAKLSAFAVACYFADRSGEHPVRIASFAAVLTIYVT